jgi:hypothetical protein
MPGCSTRADGADHTRGGGGADGGAGRGALASSGPRVTTPRRARASVDRRAGRRAGPRAGLAWPLQSGWRLCRHGRASAGCVVPRLCEARFRQGDRHRPGIPGSGAGADLEPTRTLDSLRVLTEARVDTVSYRMFTCRRPAFATRSCRPSRHEGLRHEYRPSTPGFVIGAYHRLDIERCRRLPIHKPPVHVTIGGPARLVLRGRPRPRSPNRRSEVTNLQVSRPNLAVRHSNIAKGIAPSFRNDLGHHV